MQLVYDVTGNGAVNRETNETNSIIMGFAKAFNKVSHRRA